MQLVAGIVTRVEEREHENSRTGSVNRYLDIYVASGKTTVRTVGRQVKGEEMPAVGERVVYQGEYDYRFDRLQFERETRLTKAQVAKLAEYTAA